MKKLILLAGLISSACVFAAAPVLTNPTSKYVTHGSFCIEADSDIEVQYVRVLYDRTNDPPTEFTTEYISRYAGTQKPSHCVSTVDPSTTYKVRISAQNWSGEEGVSATITVTTTAAPADRFALPTQPDVAAIPAFPTSCTYTCTVETANSCNNALNANNIQGGLQACINKAADQSGSGTNCVVIPNNATCQPASGGTYNLATRTSGGTGWISIHPNVHIVPEGFRMTSAWDIANIPKITGVHNNGFNGGAFSVNGAATKYRISGMYLTMAKSVSGLSATQYINIGSVVGGVITTDSAHGMITNEVAQFYNFTTDEYIKNARITRLSNTTLSIQEQSEATGTIAAGWKLITGPRSNGTGNSSTSTVTCLICIDSLYGASNIIFERNYIKGAGYPLGYLYGLKLQASNSYIHDNSFIDIVDWATTDPDTGSRLSSVSTATSIEVSGSNYISVQNNFFNSPGITLFVAAGGGVATANNHIYRRNLIDWDQTKFNGGPTWDRLFYWTRQPFESKNGKYWSITGNQFKTFWGIGDTGSFASAMVFTPRVGDFHKTTSNNAIGHLTIRYNTYSNLPGIINLIGGDFDGWAPQTPVTSNVWFDNNIAWNVNGRTWNTAGQPTIPVFFYLMRLNDIRITHNTMWGNYDGGYFAPIWWDTGGQGGSGLMFRNNIFAFAETNSIFWQDRAPTTPAPTSTGIAITRFKDMWKSAGNNTQTASITHNLFVPTLQNPGDGSAANYSLNGIGNCATEWDNVVNNPTLRCASGVSATNRMDYVKFLDRTSSTRPDFRLRYDSPAKSGAPTKFSDDGLDMGADVEEVFSQQGRMLTVPKLARTTTPTLRYIAPDTAVCKVERSNSSLFGATSSVWADDTGSNRVRNTTVDPTGYSYVRLHCGTEVYSCPTGGGGCARLQ